MTRGEPDAAAILTAPTKSLIVTAPPRPSFDATPAASTTVKLELLALAPYFTYTAASSRFWMKPFSPSARVKTVPSEVMGVKVLTVAYWRGSADTASPSVVLRIRRRT